MKNDALKKNQATRTHPNIYSLKIHTLVEPNASNTCLDRGSERATERGHSTVANLEGLEEVGQKRKALLRATREHRLRVRSAEVTENGEEENGDPSGLLTQDEVGLRRDLETLLSLLDHVLKLDKSIHGVVEVLGESHRNVLLRRTVVTESKVRLNVTVFHNRLDK